MGVHYPDCGRQEKVSSREHLNNSANGQCPCPLKCPPYSQSEVWAGPSAMV